MIVLKRRVAKWLLLGLIATTTAVIACNEALDPFAEPEGVDHGVDAGIDQGCFSSGGEDLAWQFAGLVHVVDSKTHDPLFDPQFTAGGNPIAFSCFGEDSTDLGDHPCTAWATHAEGDYDLTITAPGYGSATVNIDNHSVLPNGCPFERQVEVTVALVAE